MQVKSIASAILSTFIKLLFAIKTFVFSIFEWPLGFTVVKIKTNEKQGLCVKSKRNE